MKRIADHVIAYLEHIGAKDIFTVSGGGSILLNDALALNKNVNYYCCHHEQAVATASEAYARVKGGIGVSLVTTGPGGTNAITGVAGSWMDSIPHLVISGQVFLNQTIKNTGLRQLGVQEINIIDIAKPITKYAVMVEDARKTLYHLQKAIHIATTGRPGPVWVDIPSDIQMKEMDWQELEQFDPSEIEPPRYDPDLKEKVSRVVKLLQSAKRPLFHLGQGVRIAGAKNKFMAIVEKFSIPFVTARNANDMVRSDHPLFAGRPGTFPQRAGNFAVQNADVYVAVGTRLSLPQTGYDSKDYACNATTVMVDIDKAELDKHTLRIDIKIHHDAKAFLEELERQLDGCTLDIKDWVDQCRRWKKDYPVVLPEYKDLTRRVNSYYFADVLSDILSPDDVIVTDMGFAFQTTHQAFKVKDGQKFFTNCGLASMGWGLPAAIGACIANDKKRVICIAGEGGLQMTIQELATVMHYKLPIKLFVQNNGGYLTIKQTQEYRFGGRLMGCDETSGLSFPDILKVAEAHRIPAIRVENQDGLRENIKKVVNSHGPMICEIIMDKDQPQIPKYLAKKGQDGKTIPTPLEDLYPYLPPEELKKNIIIPEERR